MLSTIVILVIFLGLFILHVIFWAMFLHIGLRWAKIADATTRRVVVATVSVITLQLLVSIVFRLAAPISDALPLPLDVLELATGILIPCLVIMRLFKTSLLRSLQAWLPTLLSTFGMILFVFVVVRPLICEAFVSPSNTMAPTLLGNTWRSTCPEYGQLNYCSPADPRSPRLDSPQMICGSFHINQVSDVQPHAFPSDRFLAAKFLTPKRWDVVVFQYPENPSTTYVMRLVGFPGETIHIESGAVWADGHKLDPPPALKGVQYLSELPDWHGELWGSKNRQAVLGQDEYFVLGDFSARSKDSRLWEHGALGHNPFAVPKSHLIGVVTHVYWPPQRWRILR